MHAEWHLIHENNSTIFANRNCVEIHLTISGSFSKIVYGKYPIQMN